jgi:hypothetical protein
MTLKVALRVVNKENILKLLLAIWIVLWVLFLIREDKDGQYASLKYQYSHGREDRMRNIMTPELYDLMLFCREKMPAGSTCELAGFKAFSIDEVRARYFLWPVRNTRGDADFIIIYEGGYTPGEGYTELKGYTGKGKVLIKEGKE